MARMLPTVPAEVIEARVFRGPLQVPTPAGEPSQVNLGDKLELEIPSTVVSIEVRHILRGEGQVMFLVWLRGPMGRKWVSAFGGGGGIPGEHVTSATVTLEFHGSGDYSLELDDVGTDSTVWAHRFTVV